MSAIKLGSKVKCKITGNEGTVVEITERLHEATIIKIFGGYKGTMTMGKSRVSLVKEPTKEQKKKAQEQKKEAKKKTIEKAKKIREALKEEAKKIREKKKEEKKAAKVKKEKKK